MKKNTKPDMPANSANGEPEQNVRQVKTVPRRQIRAFVGQPRRWFNPVSLRELADSIEEVGQLTPALARLLDPPVDGHLYELIDGQRRWCACELKCIPHFRIEIETEPITEDKQFERSVVANYGKEELATMDVARAIRRFKEGMNMNEAAIATRFCRSVSWVSQHYSLLKLHPDVQALLDPSLPEEKQLTFSIAVLLTNVPEDFQVPLARSISEQHLSMAQARHLIKKTLHSQGIQKHRARPDKEFGVFAGLFSRIDGQLDLLLDTSVPQFRYILNGGSLQERMRVVECIGGNIEKLTILKETIEGIFREKPKGYR